MSRSIVNESRPAPRPSRSRLAASLVAAWAATALPAAALDVVSTTPSRYELHVAATLAAIEVTLDASPVMPDAAAFRVCGTMSGLKTGTVSVAGNTMTFTTTPDWQPGELVHVNLRSDVQTAGGDSLSGGFYFAFTIRSGLASAEWSAPTAHPAADVPYFIFGGDVDGDGTPDVVAPNEGTNDISVFLNDTGDGFFDSHTDYPVGETPSSIFGEDFDNDGDLDVATADIASSTMSVSLNEGDGTFAPSVQYLSGSITRQVHGGDFDGDNDIDLCTTSKNTDQVFLFYNQGNGTFDPGVPYSDLANGPFAIRTGDFDLDGHLDIGVACQDADSVSIMRNNGDGTFTTTGSFKVGDGPWCLNGNDFDGDGDFDLVTVASFNNRIQVLFNDGNGAFPTKLGKATGFFPLGVYAADLDGDGDIDATSSNFSAGTVGVYLNDGLGELVLDATLVVDRSGSYTWAHDLDADGDLDLSVVDELTDSLYVFYNEPVVATPSVLPAAGLATLTASPNPAFAGTGTQLRLDGFRGHVTIDVLDVAGRRLLRLHEGSLTDGGIVVWDGRGPSGRALPSGTYLVSVHGGGRSASTRVQLIR